MKTFGLAAALCTVLGLAACGYDSSDTNVTSAAPIPLEGAQWQGTPVDPTQPSDRIRVVAFFKPG